MSNNLGSNIRKERMKQQITQEKLAEISGLSLNFISRLERTNTNNVSVKNVIKIANALGVPLIELLSSSNKGQVDYPVTQRLNHMLTNMPKEESEEYASEFINILRIHNRKK